MRDMTRLATIEDYLRYWREPPGEESPPD